MPSRPRLYLSTASDANTKTKTTDGVGRVAWAMRESVAHHLMVHGIDVFSGISGAKNSSNVVDTCVENLVVIRQTIPFEREKYQMQTQDARGRTTPGSLRSELVGGATVTICQLHEHVVRSVECVRVSARSVTKTHWVKDVAQDVAKTQRGKVAHAGVVLLRPEKSLPHTRHA